MGGMSERTWRMKQQLRRALRDMVTDRRENPAAGRRGGAGTVVDRTNPIKASWDNGAASYYRHGTDADVKARES
jgi:hypothetical protein